MFCHSERLQSHPTRLKQFSLTVPTTTKGCGTGATMGLQSASDDGMTNLNVGFEYADVNNLKRRSLKLSVEHRF